MHSPTEDGLGRRVARLEEASCPEPLVDSDLIHTSILAAASRQGRGRRQIREEVLVRTYYLPKRTRRCDPLGRASGGQRTPSLFKGAAWPARQFGGKG